MLGDTGRIDGSGDLRGNGPTRSARGNRPGCVSPQPLFSFFGNGFSAYLSVVPPVTLSSTVHDCTGVTKLLSSTLSMAFVFWKLKYGQTVHSTNGFVHSITNFRQRIHGAADYRLSLSSNLRMAGSFLAEYCCCAILLRI